MSKLPVVTPQQAERAILRAGFRQVRTNGAHRHYAKDGHNLIVTISFHTGDLPSGTLRTILRQAGLTPDQFRQLL